MENSIETNRTCLSTTKWSNRNKTKFNATKKQRKEWICLNHELMELASFTKDVNGMIQEEGRQQQKQYQNE